MHGLVMVMVWCARDSLLVVGVDFFCFSVIAGMGMIVIRCRVTV